MSSELRDDNWHTNEFSEQGERRPESAAGLETEKEIAVHFHELERSGGGSTSELSGKEWR